MRNIPYGRQEINQQDINAVIDVLQSPYITQGPAIEKFEDAIKKYCEADYAFAISSGTAGLHLALLALGVGKGDVVWTSPISFVASANCALYVGADINFVDVNPKTGNIDIDLLYEKLKKAENEAKLPKVLVVVHFSGRVCDMDAIHGLSKRYGFRIIEDAAHALGASYNASSKVGCSNASDITMFSFHPVKSITTGEGGVLTTKNSEIAEKIAMLRSHGITRDADKMENDAHGAWYYEQLMLGFNYRMTDIQAALGTSQMRRLNEFINKRLAIAERYNDKLQDLPLMLPSIDKNSAWHLYVVQIDGEFRKSRKDIFDSLRSEGIGVNVHYIPIHLQPYYARLGFKPGDFPNAEKFYDRAISLPIFPSLREDEQAYIVDKLREILQ